MTGSCIKNGVGESQGSLHIARCGVGYLLGMPKSMWRNPGRCFVRSEPSIGLPHPGLEGTE